MPKILTPQFFNRTTTIVAQELLGKFLVRRIGKKTTALMITETEAYDGFLDKASHAHRGQTPRNSIMFGEAGHIYAYFTYGMHWMLNIVTGPKNYPAAVLIRGGLKLGGAKFAQVKINGPGRVTKALQIDKRLNTLRASPEAGLWFEDRGVKVNPKDIKKTPRIGIRYAGVKWGNKKYRFVLKAGTA
ncbi:MAG TPA: DNA-3-methyladenine glycosylase, partial [Candidatus Paceibacterota bacterium]